MQEQEPRTIAQKKQNLERYFLELLGDKADYKARTLGREANYVAVGDAKRQKKIQDAKDIANGTYDWKKNLGDEISKITPNNRTQFLEIFSKGVTRARLRLQSLNEQMFAEKAKHPNYVEKNQNNANLEDLKEQDRSKNYDYEFRKFSKPSSLQKHFIDLFQDRSAFEDDTESVRQMDVRVILGYIANKEMKSALETLTKIHNIQKTNPELITPKYQKLLYDAYVALLSHNVKDLPKGKNQNYDDYITEIEPILCKMEEITFCTPKLNENEILKSTYEDFNITVGTQITFSEEEVRLLFPGFLDTLETDKEQLRKNKKTAPVQPENYYKSI